ncbi:MAG: TonB-dependent receptor plug domain-containing protein, partial [Steroidobacteraceae bacterium]
MVTTMSTRIKTALTASLLASVPLAGRAAEPAEPANQTRTDAVAEHAPVLDEITVTARRTKENIQLVPVAVTALPADLMERKSVVQPYDLQQITPSLTLTGSSRGTDSLGVQIRGLRQYDTGITNDPSVGVYFGDIVQVRTQGMNNVLYDLESVQVLKGPQGTLFGRNTIGGAILFNPNAPTQEFEGYVRGSAGNYDSQDLEAVVNLPFHETAALRLSGTYRHQDGYVKNVFIDTKAHEVEAKSFRASLLWRPTENIESTTIGFVTESDGTGYMLKTTEFYPTGVNAALRPAVAPLIEQGVVLNRSLGFHEVASDQYVPTESDVHSIQNTTTFDLGSITLKNLIGYRKIEDVNGSLDSDGTMFDLLTAPSDMKANQFSEELQALGKVGSLDYLVGLYYFSEEGEDNLRVCAFCAVRAVPLVSVAGGDSENKSYSAFAHVNYALDNISEGLSFSAGARITRDERHFIVRARNQVVLPGNVVAWRCTTSSTVTSVEDRDACGLSLDAKYTEPSWELSVNKQWSPSVLTYIAHRHGYRTGSINANTRDLTDPYKYDPEQASDVEIGLKSEFDIPGAAVRLNIASYYTWLKDRQVQIQEPKFINGVPTQSAFIQNAPKAHTYGGEIDLTVLTTNNLEFSAGYSYIEAKNDEFEDHYFVNGVATSVDVSDSGFTSTPKHQINASVRYMLPYQRNGDMSMELGYYYQSKTDSYDTNTSNCGPDGQYLSCLINNAVVPSYGLWNLRAAWENPFGKRFTVAGYVTNLF